MPIPNRGLTHALFYLQSTGQNSHCRNWYPGQTRPETKRVPIPHPRPNPRARPADRKGRHLFGDHKVPLYATLSVIPSREVSMYLSALCMTGKFANESCPTKQPVRYFIFSLIWSIGIYSQPRSYDEQTSCSIWTSYPLHPWEQTMF